MHSSSNELMDEPVADSRASPAVPDEVQQSIPRSKEKQVFT
jgi:hypothetical protein